MHLEPPKEFPIECAMTLASAARDGTIFDTPRASYIHVWNLLGWGGGTFIPEQGFTAGFGSPALDDETKKSLGELKAALEEDDSAKPDVVAGPLQDFFASLLPLLLAKLQEWLDGLLGETA
jgi:hypothetical protein